MYSRSPRSFDNPRYKYNRVITAMSDPGVSLPEQHNGQHRSHVEHAPSEIASPTGMHYEPQQQRAQEPMRYIEEERHANPKHQYSQNRYSSSPSPQKSRSSEQQRVEEPMLRQMYSGDGEFTSRENYTRCNEGYHDGMYESSLSYNLRSPDSTTVKELQRQLYNTKVRDPSPPRYNRRIQQSLSPERSRQGAPTSSNNLSRFARSLSPHRRQYQQSSPMASESPSHIQKASSTMSDTSYNSRFHSKFVEAALVAHQRGDSDKDYEHDELRKHPIRQYQQQGHETFSSRPLDDSKQHRCIPKSSPVPYISNQKSNEETHKKVSRYPRGKGASVQTSRSANDTRRPPTIPPSPSSSSSPAVTSNGRHQQQKHIVSIDRGKESPQFRKSDGSARRIRPPSPLLLDRIKSFDQEYYNDSTRAVSEVREQRYGSGRQDQLQHNDWRGMSYHENHINHNGHQVSSGSSNNNTGRQYMANEEEILGPHPGRFENERKSYDARKVHPSQLSSPSVSWQNHQQNETQASRGFGRQIENDRMADLVDKLSAVNRENPRSALAQIDSILREESRSSHTKSFDNSNDGSNSKSKLQQSHNDYPAARRDYEKNVVTNISNNEEEKDDDESSDVSSITNPTFQPGTSRKNYAKNAEALYILENDHYNMHSTAPSNNIGFNPSISSFRRPRPSHLQNYSNDTSKEAKTTGRTEWKRHQIEQFPPPSTIKVKDDQGTTESPRQKSADVREMMLQKNRDIEAPRANKNKEVSREPPQESPRGAEKPKPKPAKPKKKLDRFISDKQELAEKIRGWDEMSNQLSTSRSQNEEKVDIRQNIAAFSKPHPWDSRAVQIKDTSMENADGVEASISKRTHQYGSYMRELDVDAEISVGGSRVGSGNPFERARRNIKDRSADTNPFNDQYMESNEKDTHPRLLSPGFLGIDLKDSNAMPNVVMSMNGIPQFNPSDKNQFRSSGKDRDEKKSDVEGSSWVEMPPSSFFPDVNDNYESVSSSSKPSRKPSVVSSPLITTGGQLKFQDGNRLSEPRSITRLACKTVSPKEPKTKEKKRGFLQKFMEKKKGNSRSVGYTASASAGSMSGHSVSVESRGVKSASYVQTGSTIRANTSDAMPRASNFQILAAPPGVLAAGKNAPRGRGGHRNATSSSPGRGRSKSTDKFRSSSMEQKFNRVMQLYDSDET